jgi:hypothetical protein
VQGIDRRLVRRRVICRQHFDLGTLVQREHMMLGSRGPQVNRIGLARGLFQAPEPRVEIHAGRQVADGEIEAADVVDAWFGHGALLPH